MAKRFFKLKFSCIVPYFQLCRSKKPSKLTETSVPVIHRRLSTVKFPAPPPSTPDYSFVKRHLYSPKIALVDCGCRARSSRTQYVSPDVSFESTRLQKMAKAHNSKLQRRSYEGRPVNDESTNGKYKVNRKEKKKATVSSTDSGCFSSELGDEDEETETLISNSISFSDDSSFELDQSMAYKESPMEMIKRNKKIRVNSKKMKRLGSFGSRKYKGRLSTENETPWRSSGSMLKRTTTMTIPPCTAEDKVAESVAAVKKSEDPYQDFKRSMLEMILEKQMFEAKDLEQLLQCFLSLNSKQYHRIIVEAFTEIWEALFSDYAMNVL